MSRSGLKRTPSLGTIPSISNLSISSIDSPNPAGSNALNRPAQASQSLYPLCQDLLERLYCVEGFEKYLIQGQNNTPNNSSIVGTPTTENSPNSIIRNDPVTLLWQTFRLGYPLCALFNALKPQEEAVVEEIKPDTNNKAKVRKANIYRFLVACQKELQLKPEQIFTISQLEKDDTNGFVKVIDTVKHVTDKIEEKGLLDLSRRQLLRNSDPMKPVDNRARVVHELLETERKYVQDMEVLQNFARELQIQEIVSADTIHLLFANLNQLVDFQRRFLIGVESNASQPPAEQRFGNLFIQTEENFAVYEPFCSNYQSASELVIQETPNLQKLANIVEPTYVLPSLLIKPIQRICKYPLLLQELLKFSDKDETPYYDEIERGLKAIKRVADRVNETRRKQENEAVVKDLERRVEDWKGHKISHFGDLLLEDVFIMSKEDSEREYHVYLFERILLCCKEAKIQNKSSPLIKSTNRKQKRVSLQLKGRIFIHNITAVLNNSRSGLWSLKVFWRGDTEMESFSLKCRNEEQLNQWQSTLEKLLEDLQQRNKDESVKPVVKRTQVSDTQLASLQNLELPVYSRRDDDDAASFIDEDEDEEEYEDEEDDDWGTKHINNKSQSLPYGQYPASGHSGRARPRTDDGLAPPPYNWPNSPPSVPNVPPQHRSHANMSMPPLPRNGTMAPNIIYQDNAGYFQNPPPPYPHSARSSSSTNSANTWKRRSIEKSHLTDTVPKFMAGNEEEYAAQPMQRAHSHSAASGQTFQQANGPIQVLQQTPPPNPPNLNRLRSASSPNIQAIKEAQWENLDPLPNLPTNKNIQNNNGIQSSEVHQRNSGSSTSSQVHDLSSPTNGAANGHSNFSITMKIKVNYADDIFVIVVPQNIEYKDLCDRVERKIRISTTQRNENIPLRIKYQDEDGDYITINSDEDVMMAFGGRLAAGGNFVNLYVV